MITASLADSIAAHHDRIVSISARFNLSAPLIAAIVSVESGGNQYAQRVERGFWSRYAAGIMRWVGATATPADDFWSRYPDVYSSSYGLMQVMLQVAAESGFAYRYPGELFDPERNLMCGCMILARHLREANGDERQALLRYNGGADPAYPDRVFARRSQLVAVGAI